MAHYYFSYGAASGSQVTWPKAREFPDLGSALFAARRAAQAVVRIRNHQAPGRMDGHLEIQDDLQRPVARILLAEIRRQTS